MQIAIYMQHGRVQRVGTSARAEIAVVIEDTGEVWSAPLSLENEIARYCDEARDASRRFAFGAVCEVTADALTEISRRQYETGRALLSDVRDVLQGLYSGLQTASAL